MQTVVECVPNFSEGRNRHTVEEIAAAIAAVPDAFVLDLHLDPDHNRSVITFVGNKGSVGEAAVRAVGRAAELIDLNRHQGVHPRIGAADIVPFTPVQGTTLEECVAIAHRTGEEIYARYRIPVYFYEAAALRPERIPLERVRGAGYERLRSLGLEDPSRWPDVGQPRLHPTAGATIVGARPFLIAFNVNLDSSDRKVAQEIARKIRSSGGGLPGVKAMGVLLESRRAGGRSGQALLSQGVGPPPVGSGPQGGGQGGLRLNGFRHEIDLPGQTQKYPTLGVAVGSGPADVVLHQASVLAPLAMSIRRTWFSPRST